MGNIDRKLDETCKDRMIAEALELIPDDYRVTWKMFWESDDEKDLVITDGPNWEAGIPGGQNWSNARERASRYSEYMSTHIKAAEALMNKCRKALKEGDIETARKAFEDSVEWHCDDTTSAKLAEVLGLDDLLDDLLDTEEEEGGELWD